MLNVMRLTAEAKLPVRAYPDSAAYDLFAHLLTPGGHSFILTLPPNSVKLIGTGIALRPPPGHLVLVCSRSGYATNGIFVANAPGVVDPDYTGEIKVILYNGSMEPFYVRHGDRIAQALVTQFNHCELQEVNEFPPTLRGDKGFGSTGD